MLFQWLQRSYSLPGIAKHDISWNSWNFMKFREFSWNFMKFLEFYQNFGFGSSPECQAPQPLLFPKENKGFVKGGGWLKTQNLMNFIRNYEISGNFMIFINSYDFYAFLKISALQRRHAKRTVIPMLFQWLQPPHSPPGTPKTEIPWNSVKFNEILWNFMNFGEI